MTPLTRKIDNVDRPLYYLRRTADKSEINPRAFSNTAGLPNPGPGQEYLPVMVDDLVYNRDFQTYTAVEAANEVLKTWEIKFTIQDKPQPAALAVVDVTARQETIRLVGTQDVLAALIVLTTAIIREMKIKTLTPAEQASADIFAALSTKLLANQANADAKKTVVKAGGKPDPKTGWSP